MMKSLKNVMAPPADLTLEKTSTIRRKSSMLATEDVRKKSASATDKKVLSKARKSTSSGNEKRESADASIPKDRKLVQNRKSTTSISPSTPKKQPLSQTRKSVSSIAPEKKSTPQTRSQSQDRKSLSGNKQAPKKQLESKTGQPLALKRKSVGVEPRGSLPEQAQLLKRKKTVELEPGTQSKSTIQDKKRASSTKTLLDLKRESLTALKHRKLSTGSQSSRSSSQPKTRKVKKTSKVAQDNIQPKTESPKIAVEEEKSLQPVQSELETPVPSGSASLHDEKMAALQNIVTQAELDQRIFCIFDNHRYISKPIREELTKRGWAEFQAEKSAILRKNHSSPSKINMTAIDTTPQKLLRRTKAILPPSSNENKTLLHVSSPVKRTEPQQGNDDILNYCSNWDFLLPAPLMKRAKPAGHEYRSPSDSKLISKLIEENAIQISLVWLSSKPVIQLPYFSYVPEIVNKFQKTSFCTKHGLWLNLKENYKNLKHLQYPVQTPRMYNLGDRHSYEDFEFDFYTTAVTSVLRWLVSNLADEGVSSISGTSGKVPQRVFDFAIQKTHQFIKYLTIGNSVTRDDIMRSKTSWSNLLLWFYKLINEQEKMETVPTTALYILHSQAVEALRALREIKPESVNDGITNLWIVKPYSASCGRGIFVTNNLTFLERLDQKRYIIQKYIERPFLICGVKFDIRQWFMVTSLTPVQIWIYKESYLRFCSVPFQLNNLHESVHLTNNAIQKKYAKNVGLPCQNMWDSNTFQRYLRETGYPSIWEERIYPGMRDALVATILCCESTFDTNESKFPPRKGWFEVYGADFLLTQNLREGPWLIEINENPALDPSTPVTEYLCPKMLRDVVKVVVDWRNDAKSSTGNWELAFSGDA